MGITLGGDTRYGTGIGSYDLGSIYRGGHSEGKVIPLYNTSPLGESPTLKSLEVGFIGTAIEEVLVNAAPAAPVKSAVFLRNFLLLESDSDLVISFLSAIFGPQKGASPDDVVKLESSLSNLAKVTLHQFGNDMSKIRHGGAAGGTAAGLHTFLNAKLENGIDYFLQLTEFDHALEKHDLVITGEGSIDEQTLHGKGPYGVAYRAKQKNVTVIGIAGKVPLVADKKMNAYFDILVSIGNGPSDISTAMQSTKVNLKRTARQIGNLIALHEVVTRQNQRVGIE